MKKTFLPVAFLAIAGIISPTFTSTAQAASYIYDDLNRLIRVIEDGEHVLRAKIDMTSPNLNMRDPTLYRIRRETHHRTGDRWC